MTLYHFGNCLALVYVPYYFTYKHSGLSEYGAFWKCVQAGGVYVFTQLLKMLIIATFFPNEQGRHESYDLFGEFLKATVDILDLCGMYLVLTGIPGKGHAKVLTAGVGWAGAEILLTRFVLLWVGARGAEFDWTYIQKSLDSNISLIVHITTATLLWLRTRHDLKSSLFPVVTGMLLVRVYQPLLMETLVHSVASGPWVTLIIKAFISICLGLTTLQIYTGLAKSIGIY